MATPETPPLLDILTIERPEQLKALGHPLRLRVLEMLGQSEGQYLTNRELAQRLGVDPGHLHFHVRMLLRAGLIALAEGGHGREKPYRAVARTVRVASELISSSDAVPDLRATMVDDVQRAMAEFRDTGQFRITQTTVRIPWQRAMRLIEDIAETVRDEETADADPLVITAFMHPARTASSD
jgi:DNA-binding transcriptional ArsR family regulator